MRRLLTLGGVTLAAAVGTGIAIAVVLPTVLVYGDTNTPREKVARYEFTPTADQSTFSPGWHIHQGPAIVQVQEGQITISQNCRTYKLHRGDTYSEVPFVPVNAVTKGHVVWTTTYLLVNSLAGGADRVATDPPSCPRGDDDGDSNNQH